MYAPSISEEQVKFVPSTQNEMCIEYRQHHEQELNAVPGICLKKIAAAECFLNYKSNSQHVVKSYNLNIPGIQILETSAVYS